MKLSSPVLCFAVLLSIVPAIATAQTAAPAPAAAPPAAATSANRAADTLDFAGLRNYLSSQVDVVQKLQQKIDASLRDAQLAPQVYDEMVAAYRTLIDTVGSRSGQVTQIDEFIAQYERYAEEAAGSANPRIREKSDEFRRIVRAARETRAGFIEESNKASINIDRLRDLKEEAVVNIRLQRGQDTVVSLRAQLAVLQEANTRVDAEIKKAEQQNLPITGPRPQ
jgi:hypothetical protein